MISRYFDPVNSGGVRPNSGNCSRLSTLENICLARLRAAFGLSRAMYSAQCHSDRIKLAQSKLFEPFAHFIFCIRLAISAIFKNSGFTPRYPFKNE